MAQHVVEQGECLASIAKRYGFSNWRTIYNHAQNAGFRRRRPDPNVIFPNDVLFVPDRDTGTENCSTEQRHRFRRHACTCLLRLMLKDEGGQALANEPYRLEVEDRVVEGSTDASGLIEIELAPDVERAEIALRLLPKAAGEGEEILNVDYPDQEDSHSGSPASDGRAKASAPPAQKVESTLVLEVGSLDPVEEITGIQARLCNLGFNPGPIDGICGDLTKAAVRRFQQAYNLTSDGIPGPVTQSKLKEAHGC